MIDTVFEESKWNGETEFSPDKVNVQGPQSWHLRKYTYRLKISGFAEQ